MNLNYKQLFYPKDSEYLDKVEEEIRKVTKLGLEYGPVPKHTDDDISKICSQRKAVTIKDNNEQLVSLKEYIKVNNIHNIVVSNRYYYNPDPVKPTHLESSIDDALVREDIAKKIKNVAVSIQNDFPSKGIVLDICDAYRSVNLQKSLYDYYYDWFKKLRILQNYKEALKECGITQEQLEFYQYNIDQFAADQNELEFNDNEYPLNYQELDTFVQQYVSLPNSGSISPSPHATGGAIDLMLAFNIDNQIIRFRDDVVRFDDFSEKCKMDYYENVDNYFDIKGITLKAMNRYLYHKMIEQGFSNLPSEQWHYSFGDQIWAYLNNKEAYYGFIEQSNIKKVLKK